jgi:hypothetical protein
MMDDHPHPQPDADFSKRVGLFVWDGWVFLGESLIQAGKHVTGFEEQVINAIEFEFRAAIFGKEDFIFRLEFDALIVADGDNLSRLRFLFCSIRQEQAGSGFTFLLQRLDKDSRPKRLDVDLRHVI